MSSQIDKQSIVNLLNEKISSNQAIYKDRVTVQNTKNWKRESRSTEPGNIVTRTFSCRYDPVLSPLEAIVVHKKSLRGKEIIRTVQVTYADGIEIASSRPPIKKKRKRSVKKLHSELDRFNFDDE